MIKTTRKRQNLTQKELAQRVGLSQSYLSKLENSRKVLHSPTITQVISIAGALEVSTYVLAKWFIDKEIGGKNKWT